MRIEQLLAFLAVVETGSFQKAAMLRHTTQSTISRQIQCLEGEMGLPLVHRTAQAKLTVAGEKFLPRARRICQEWESITKEITELKAGKQPELCVAGIPSVCAYYLPSVLQKFCQDYPEVPLRVTALGSDRALKVLKDSLVDLAIVMNNRLLVNSPETVVQILYEEPIELLMAADHPLSQYEQVPWLELANYPQIVFKDGYGMQRLIQEQFSQRGIPLKMALELNTPDAFRGVVRQGTMIALLPRSCMIEALNDPALTIRAIAPDSRKMTVTPISQSLPLTRQVVLVTTQDRLQIPPIQHFYNLVCQELAVFSKIDASPQPKAMPG